MHDSGFGYEKNQQSNEAWNFRLLLKLLKREATEKKENLDHASISLSLLFYDLISPNHHHIFAFKILFKTRISIEKVNWNGCGKNGFLVFHSFPLDPSSKQTQKRPFRADAWNFWALELATRSWNIFFLCALLFSFRLRCVRFRSTGKQRFANIFVDDFL